MSLTEKLTAALIRDEGERLKPYRCTAGKLTIGVGRNLDDVGITREESRYLLAGDIKRFQDDLFRALPWARALDEARRGVLLNMAFNLGMAGLLGFKNTLELIRTGQYAEAAKAMLASKWAKQVGARADRLARQMETGAWV